MSYSRVRYTTLCPTFVSYPSATHWIALSCLCISPHCLPPLYYLRAAGQLAWTGAQKQEDDECSSRAACPQFSQDAHNFHKMSTIYCFIFLSKNCAAFLKGTIQLFTLYLWIWRVRYTELSKSWHFWLSWFDLVELFSYSWLHPGQGKDHDGGGSKQEMQVAFRTNSFNFLAKGQLIELKFFLKNITEHRERQSHIPNLCWNRKMSFPKTNYKSSTMHSAKPISTLFLFFLPRKSKFLGSITIYWLAGYKMQMRGAADCQPSNFISPHIRFQDGALLSACTLSNFNHIK